MSVEEALQNHGYTIVKFINNGSFGSCFLVNSTKFNQDFVAKVSMCENADSKYLESLKCEAEILSKLNHPNIVRIYDYFVDVGQVFMILEYCSGGSLYDIIHDKVKKSTNKILKYSMQIIDALSFMHNKGFAHCDIKLSNILLDKFDRIKICDFGLSHFLSKNDKLKADKGVRGTMNYMSPEILLGFDYDPYKADVWALGVTLFCLIKDRFPFCAANTNILLEDINDNNGKLTEKDGPLAEIINMCFELEPVNRPTMQATRLKMLDIYNNCIDKKPKSCTRIFNCVAKTGILGNRKRLGSSLPNNKI